MAQLGVEEGCVESHEAEASSQSSVSVFSEMMGEAMEWLRGLATKSSFPTGGVIPCIGSTAF